MEENISHSVSLPSLFLSTMDGDSNGGPYGLSTAEKRKVVVAGDRAIQMENIRRSGNSNRNLQLLPVVDRISAADLKLARGHENWIGKKHERYYANT